MIRSALVPLIVASSLTGPATSSRAGDLTPGISRALDAVVPANGRRLGDMMRIAGSVEVVNAAGQVITLSFVGSTHDWDEELRARADEVAFVARGFEAARFRQNCEALLAEQAGSDEITPLLWAALDDERLITREVRDQLARRLKETETGLALDEFSAAERLFADAGVPTINADLYGSFRALDAIFDARGPGAVFDALSDFMLNAFDLDESADGGARLVLPIGNFVLSHTRHATYFSAHPFSLESALARSVARDRRAHVVGMTDRRREQWFARRVLAAPGSVCLMAHTAHIRNVLGLLSARTRALRITEIEPNTELREIFASDPSECRRRFSPLSTRLRSPYTCPETRGPR